MRWSGQDWTRVEITLFSSSGRCITAVELVFIWYLHGACALGRGIPTIFSFVIRHLNILPGEREVGAAVFSHLVLYHTTGSSLFSFRTPSLLYTTGG